MSGLRRALVNAGVLILAGLHLLELARDSEHWPFSSYPMYSWLESERAVASQRLVGVCADTGKEVLLQGPRYLYPFDQSRLAEAFREIRQSPDAAARWKVVVPDLLARYERRRLEGRHSGPALKGMRVYWTRHRLDPAARNLTSPEEMQLLAEVVRP